MNNYLNLSTCGLRGLCFCALFNLVSTDTFAQKTPPQPPPPAIKGAKTDNNYANTTEISKSKNASDEQVLSEIQGNYGLGDVVRIVITTPKPVTEPLGRSSNGKTATGNVSPVPIPLGQLTPITNLPTPQQAQTPPQYNAEGEPIATPNNRPNGQMTPIGNRTPTQQAATPIKYDENGQPIVVRPNGQMTPIGNRTPTQQAATPIKYGENGQPIVARPNGQMTPIGNRTPTQQAATPIKYGENGQPIVTRPNGQMTPIGNRTPTQQAATPIKYGENGQPIVVRPNGQMTPIGNRTPTQQTTTPPQYKPNSQPSATIVAAKTPDNGSTITASNTLDLSNFFGKNEAVVSKTVVTTVEETPAQEQEQIERKSYTSSNRTARSSSGSSSKASKSSKSSGFSLKNMFSFGKSGMKKNKRGNMKSSKKYGCYRFN